MASTSGGFTAIYGPDGSKLTKDIPKDWEGMIYGDLDVDQISYAKSVADPVGHYSRPDLFTLVADDRRKAHVVCRGGGNEPCNEHTDMLSGFKELDVATPEDFVETPSRKALVNGTSVGKPSLKTV